MEGEDSCPIEVQQKKCAVVSADLVRSLGKHIPKPVPFSDAAKLIGMSDTVLYNGGRTMRGDRHTMAVDVSNTGSWVRFDIDPRDSRQVEELVRRLDCI
jgi:hypothetical protein